MSKNSREIFVKFYMYLKLLEEEFHCKECDKSFSSAYALKYHAILHSNDSKLFYRCPNCDYEGRLVGNLKKHIFNQHYKNRIAEFQAFWENSE